MKLLKLPSAKPISRIGLGCLQIVEPVSTAPSESQAISLIQQAKETGINFFDTSDIYGLGESERIVGKALNLSQLTESERQHIIIATKCGLIRTDDGLLYNGSKAHIKKACEESLARLGTPYIDIYYLHRIDEKVPLHESMEAMAELLEEGKIHYVGLSEVTLDQIYEANKTVKISFVQNEFSLVERTDEYNGLISACADMGIYYVPYCPLGRGLLSTEMTANSHFSPDDFRTKIPRLQAENLSHNVAKRKKLEEFASQLGCSTAQLALAWTLTLGDHVIPIPGTRTLKYLLENANAVEVNLTESQVEDINQTFHKDYFQGERSPATTTVNKALSSPKLGSKLKAIEPPSQKPVLPKQNFSAYITKYFINSPVFSTLKLGKRGDDNQKSDICKFVVQELKIPKPNEPERIHVASNTK